MRLSTQTRRHQIAQAHDHHAKAHQRHCGANLGQISALVGQMIVRAIRIEFGVAHVKNVVGFSAAKHIIPPLKYFESRMQVCQHQRNIGSMNHAGCNLTVLWRTISSPCSNTSRSALSSSWNVSRGRLWCRRFSKSSTTLCAMASTG